MTGRAEAVVGMHFFNPVPVMPLVEVVRSDRTGGATVDRTGGATVDRTGDTTVDRTGDTTVGRADQSQRTLTSLGEL